MDSGFLAPARAPLTYMLINTSLVNKNTHIYLAVGERISRSSGKALISVQPLRALTLN